MKVCLITGEFPPMQGGVGDYTRELSHALSTLAVEVHVITPRPANSTELDTPAYQLHPVIDKWNWSCWPRIFEIMHAERPDVIHIQYQTAAYAMHPAINFLPLRLRFNATRPNVVVTYHDLYVPYLFPKAGAVRWWVTLAPARWSDAVINTTLGDYNKLIRALPSASAHLIRIGSNIHPTAPPDYDRAAWRAHLGVGPDDILLSYFGFLNERKGGETLIRALHQLAPLYHGLRLLMIGGKVGASDPTNLAYLQKIERLIAELGLAERVIWTDYVPSAEVSAHFWASDMGVLPYREGASFRHGTFMAALAHGLPIVSTRTENTPPELRNGENVLLVPPDDAPALARGIARLIESSELRQRLSAGISALAPLFAWDTIARQTLDIYRQMGKWANGQMSKWANGQICKWQIDYYGE